MKTAMKNMMNVIGMIALSATVLVAGNPGSANDATITSNENCLLVKLNVTEDAKELDNTTVKVYMDNELVSVINSEIAPLHKISLKRNQHYTLEISRPGYNNKLISISTMMPDNVVSEDLFVYQYDLELNLVKEEVKTDAFYVDFPSALISYNATTDKFDYSKKYTKHIQNKMKVTASVN